jgi:hypothetical protein
MEWPRFQFDIGDPMMAVTLVAALLALLISVDVTNCFIAILYPSLRRCIVDRHIRRAFRSNGVRGGEL